MGDNQRPRPHGLVTRVHCPAGPELSGRSGRHEKARVVQDAGFCYSRVQDPTPAPLLYQGNGAPPESEMTSRLSSVTETPTTPESNPGVQLVQADVAKATQPGLFDNLPDSAFTVDHNLLIGARPADRMLLCLALDVSASAVKVAVALAYHGWTSWPSRETLCRLTNLKSPHVTRATNELEKAGFVVRRRRYHTGGNVGIQYTFNGMALAEATAHQEHPTLQTAITNLVTAPQNTRDQDPTAITNLVTAEEEDQEARADAVTNPVTAEPGISQRDYQIGNRAVTNLVPEPEDRTGRVTLIDDHQSISGSGDSTNDVTGHSDARATEICPACDSTDFAPPACTNCGLIADLPATPPEAVPSPPWYKDLAAKIEPSILPAYQWLTEAQMLAGWSDQVMRMASETYARVYRGKTVNAPLELFKKLAIQAARELSRQQPPAMSKSKRSR